MNYALFLDDTRLPNEVYWASLPVSYQWVVVRHHYDFVKCVESHGLPIYVTFDFDLDRHGLDLEGKPHVHGIESVKWLIEYCKNHNYQFPYYSVHSTNEHGNPEMKKCIEEFINNQD